MELEDQQKAQLIELVGSEGYTVLLTVLQELVKTQKRSVLTYDIDNGDPQQQSYLRCKADGANRLVSALEQYLMTLVKESG